MRTHHGGIQVQSQPGVGTSFTLLFPAIPAAVRTLVAAPEPVEVAQVPSSCVLVVDDEATIRELAADILTAEGISVYLAASGMEGIEHFRQHPGQIALVLLDLKMPGLSGEDTLQALRQIDPQVNVILSSGYSETEVTNHFREGEIIAFLQKPYSVDLLLQHVHRVLARKTPA
jgi:DNA-binding NtrC family response regulator